VRVAHHGDCILRIEIAEPPAGDPGAGGRPETHGGKGQQQQGKGGTKRQHPAL
jgi:hypothetical protein